jgi:hypothetical protein
LGRFRSGILIFCFDFACRQDAQLHLAQIVTGGWLKTHRSFLPRCIYLLFEWNGLRFRQIPNCLNAPANPATPAHRAFCIAKIEDLMAMFENLISHCLEKYATAGPKVLEVLALLMRAIYRSAN